MPEGDTIYRTAATLVRWIGGRTVTEVRSAAVGVAAQQLVGRRVEAVEPRGKHLLIRFDGGLSLHTHMRMTGSWHVYPAGSPWRRPQRQAGLVLTCGDRVAVCFNAPVVEVLSTQDELLHPSLRGLGPDILSDPLDVDAIRRRARAASPDTPTGEVLLDQRVVCGIGNFYRCEALFVERIDPATPVGGLDDATFDRLVAASARLMRANLGNVGRDVGAGADQPFVYGRAGRPCRRCGAVVRSRRMGEHARTVYWCPTCQPAFRPAGDEPVVRSP